MCGTGGLGAGVGGECGEGVAWGGAGEGRCCGDVVAEVGPRGEEGGDGGVEVGVEVHFVVGEGAGR